MFESKEYSVPPEIQTTKDQTPASNWQDFLDGSKVDAVCFGIALLKEIDSLPNGFPISRKKQNWRNDPQAVLELVSKVLLQANQVVEEVIAYVQSENCPPMLPELLRKAQAGDIQMVSEILVNHPEATMTATLKAIALLQKAASAKPESKRQKAGFIAIAAKHFEELLRKDFVEKQPKTL